MKRPSKNQYYLNAARELASRSTCLRRRYGAIIINNDQLISSGYNGSARGVINCIDNGSCDREDQGIPPGKQYEMCLTGDTKILLTDGTSKSMEDIYNDRQWGVSCLSYDEVSKSVVTAIAEDTRITDFVTELYEITFNTGDKIRCTEENRFLMADTRTYLKAHQLQSGEALLGGFYLGNIFFEKNVFIESVNLMVLEKETVPVYDITVPMYENFAISLSDNIFIYSHNCHSVHAEANAIISAARRDMLGATMYLVGIDAETNNITKQCEPCMMCRRAIINSGIARVVMLSGETDIDGGYIEKELYRDTLIQMENATFKRKE